MALQPKRFGRVLSLAFAGSCMMALVAHAYLGFSARYLADDFCFAAKARALGVLAAQIDLYRGWRGVFAHSFFASLAGLTPPQLVSYMPATVLAVWLVALTWTIAQFALMARARYPLLAALSFATLTLYATVYGTLNIVQSLYWLSGTLSYTTPLVILTIFVGLVAFLTRRAGGHRPHSAFLILGAGLTLIAGGFSEVFLTMQTGVLLVTLVMVLRIAPGPAARTAGPLVLAGLVGSLIALAIVGIAPGNDVRLQFFSRPPLPLVLVPLLSPIYALLVLGGFVLSSTIPIAVLSVGGAVLSAVHYPDTGRLAERAASLVAERRRAKRSIVLSLIVPSAFASVATVYGIFAGPSPRAQIAPLFLTAGVVLFWSIVVGLAVQHASASEKTERAHSPDKRALVVVGILLLIPLLSAGRTASLVNDRRAYSVLWDERDNQMREAAARGEKTLVVPALGFSGGLDDVEPRAKSWVSVCMARYYGVDSVMAERRNDTDFPRWFQNR